MRAPSPKKMVSSFLLLFKPSNRHAAKRPPAFGELAGFVPEPCGNCQALPRMNPEPEKPAFEDFLGGFHVGLQ